MPNDPQDPLPESKWFYRRIFTFVSTVTLLGIVWFRTNAMAEVAKSGSETAIKGLVTTVHGCLWLIGALILFYLLAPSAEQLTKLIQTGAALRSGVLFRGRQGNDKGASAQADVGARVPPGTEIALTDEIRDTGLPGIGRDPIAEREEFDGKRT